MLQWPRPMSVLLCVSLLAACQQRNAPPAVATPTPVLPATPARALQALTRDLRANDLEGFARDAVPPGLHAQLDAAWRDGRTRWPLQELPFAERLPALLAALAAPDAQARLQQGFDRQFAGQDAQIRGAVASLGVFGVRYLQDQGDFSAAERAHYTQLVQAASRWGARAPLGDRDRARQAIAQLGAAARATGLASPADFSRAGMEASLRRMGRFQAVFKQAVARYGLDLDAGLDSAQASLQQQTGDTAIVRLRYRLAGQDIDALVPMRRVAGHWYVDDYLQHATAAVADRTLIAATHEPPH